RAGRTDHPGERYRGFSGLIRKNRTGNAAGGRPPAGGRNRRRTGSAYHSLEVAQMLESQIWGQGFPPPLFCDTFTVQDQRVVGERHLKLRLLKDGQRLEAMRFNSLEPLPARVRAAYRISVNEFNGLKRPQLTVESFEP